MTNEEFKQQLAMALAAEIARTIIPYELKSSRLDYDDMAWRVSTLVNKIVSKIQIENK